MNGKELVKNALDGLPVPRIPTGPLAVHYCAGLAGYSVREYTLEASKLADSVVRYYETFEPDAVWISADTWITAEAMGASVAFPGKNQPLCGTGIPSIESMEDVAAIPTEGIEQRGRYPLMAEALRRVKAEIGSEAFIVGCFDQSPFSAACQLMGMEAAMISLVREDGLVQAVMDKAGRYASAYGELLAGAGADMLSTGDSPAGLIGRNGYKDIALPTEKEVFGRLRGTGKFLSLHICGNCSHIVREMARSGADVLEIDSQVSIFSTLHDIPSSTALWGNIDPLGVIRNGTPEDVKEEAGRLIRAVQRCRNRRFVLSTGCTLTADTPADNLHALINSAAFFSVNPLRT